MPKEMKPTEKPIIFSTPMVQAIMAGRKTQTRRIVSKYNSDTTCNWDELDFSKAYVDHLGNLNYLKVPNPSNKTRHRVCPMWTRDDTTLWVRETFGRAGERIFYRSDNNELENAGLKGMYDFEWKPSIHMPKAAARIWLEVESVGVERLQEISEEDAIAEGVNPDKFPGPFWSGYQKDRPGGSALQAIGDTPPDWMDEPHLVETAHLDRTAVQMYRALWSNINGPDSWDANPWVWKITFKRFEISSGSGSIG